MAVTVKTTTLKFTYVLQRRIMTRTERSHWLLYPHPLQDGGRLVTVDRAPLKPADASVPIVAPFQQ